MIPLLAALAFPAFDLQAYERTRVVHLADAALTSETRTITSARNPHSAGGPHDFSSDADYWWPDPKNPDGPYIQRDGMTNPDNFIAHRLLMRGMAEDVDALAAAYKITHEEKYAAAAVKQLRVFFVDPATKMNPNLEYSQAIKGLNTGRSIGVIDTLHIAETALAIEALRGSRALTPQIESGLVGWFREYLTWLRTHPFGIEESKAKNNHGTCWTLQAACFAHLVGDKAVLAECRHRLVDVHLPNQMADDGSFPDELRRTKPYGYSIFNLDVMAALAVVLSTRDDDLMNHALPDGRSVVRGVAFLAPYIADKNAWLKNVHRAVVRNGAPQMTGDFVQPDVMYWDDWPVRQPFLLFGALAAKRADWLELWQRLDADPKVEEIRRNFPIRQPVLWVN